MLWSEAEAAIRAHIEAQWALSAHSTVTLQFENDPQTRADTYVHISVQGFYADKTIYGSAGKRLSIEGGIVFIHAFTPRAVGKALALQLVETMTAALELQSIATGINMDGGNPPSPVDQGDSLVPQTQPGGNYYRCSGSVPFVVIGSR